jgi:hypothetical protein
VTTMSTQHPITPPPELVLALRDSAPHALRRTAATRETWLITHAYQVGADIQLDVVLAKLKQLLQPVAVSERPWEREGWCDDEGRCWMGDPGGGGFIPSWRLCRAEDAPSMKVSLPHNALPFPEAIVHD